ncbi:MAG: PilZ domain-containing protein [Candidatus Omnitrophota bacterium]
MSYSGNERRQHIRVPRALAMQYRLKKSRQKGADTNTWHLSMTSDMSANGIAFESAVPFLPGDVLELQVVMSGVLDVVKGHGKVVRVEEKIPGKIYIVAVELKNHF